MNRRLLIADGSSEVLVTLEGFLQGASQSGTFRRVEVCRAGNADQARRALESGPLAAVLVDQELGGEGGGIELLALSHRLQPDAPRLLMTAFPDLDTTVRALHEGRILRILNKPIVPAELLAAIEAALDESERLQRRRVLTEQLLFSRESLMSMSTQLEQRLEEEIGNLQNMQDLAVRLNSSGSLAEVAREAAHTISEALGGRATRVELENPYRGQCESASSTVGNPRSPSSHIEPVHAPEGEVGSITVDVSRPLDERERRVLSSLASSSALAAHVQIRRFERDEAQHATVFAMARLAENRDNETGQHLDRVSEYCRLIALGLREDGHHVDQITDSFVADLVLSAPLHDIGKVGIPDHILLKPGKLDPEEWAVMQTHTLIGGETLRSIIESTAQPGFLRMGHDIALFHHEKWDGSGYPRGLSGREIPLCARIVALADVFDALTTRRPYKEPWPTERALDLIRDQRGRHFDPDVVDAFLNRVEAADRIRRSHPDEPEGGEPEGGAADLAA